MKKIASLTMLRHDDFFLRKWVAWYGSQLGMENLYIFFDGQDHTIPDYCEGTHAEILPHRDQTVAKGDRSRADFLSGKAAELFTAGYDMVIGTDVDEFLIPDPRTGEGLRDFLSKYDDGRISISGLGIDIGQDLRCEGPIEAQRPFLSQRHSAMISTRYSKTSVLCKSAAWGSGFHRVRHANFRIVPDLFLFHFGSLDEGRILAKFSDSERISNGWEKHFGKRLRTIHAVSSMPAGDWEEATARARHMQNILRPVYAINKPAMLGLKVCVQIPERFKELV